MHGRLLVADRHVWEVGILEQRLADARDVAVAEDAEDAGEEPVLAAVALDVLVFQEGDDGLGGGQSNGGGHGGVCLDWRSICRGRAA